MRAFALLLSTCLVWANACAAVPASKLVISGSSTMAPMVVAIGQRFMALHPGVTVEVLTGGGSNRGVEDMMQGKGDIGMASRPLTDKESGLFSFTIGRDGVCLIVHKSNAVQRLSNRQVRDIFVGTIDNWSRVGGPNAPIFPVNVNKGYSALETFTQYFGIRYADIKPGTPANENQERIDAVIGNPNAIAYVSVGLARKQVAAGAPLKLLPVDGVVATAKNIRNGNFPLSRPLLLLTNRAPTGLKRDFINFTLSSEITDIVLAHDFVPYLD